MDTHSRETSCMPLLLLGDEVEPASLLFYVVVVAGPHLRVVLGAEQIQELRVLYAEERVGERLLVLVGEVVPDHPGVALDGSRLLYHADLALLDDALLLHVVQDAVLQTARRDLPVRDRQGG